MKRLGYTTAIFCLVASVVGCFPEVPLGDSEVDVPGSNIASAVLPGNWEVVGEPVIFHFDDRGIPVSISNYEDPEDWRTNVEFGIPRRIEAPIGSLDIIFEPGQPFINSRTGEARFDASGTGSNIQFLFLPIPGQGHATFEFVGDYDFLTGELSGTIKYAVYYGSLLITQDENIYTLRKVR
ncbi:MAG: hypothetical protein ACYTBZ_20880 [Planctomycetota bacterium]